ncbi:MAG TPA: signal peptidase I [Thermoplasmata archaeon]
MPEAEGSTGSPAPVEPGRRERRWDRWRRRWRSEKVIVKDHSMEPTFRPGDRLLVDPLAYRDEGPTRNDLVVVADPADPARWLLKRVVATAGDFVRVTHGGVERRPIRSPADAPSSGGTLEELEVPPEHVFVLSDRPAHTRDSRQFGSIPRRAVLGRVWRRYYPAHRAGPV